MRLEGVFPPITTPFTDGAVDAGKLAENIRRYERCGLAGYLLLGSTGEAAALDEGEREVVLRAARAAVPRGRPLIAGVGMESTAATVRTARTAARCGADFVLVVTPFYFRSRMTEAALERHFATVADASPVPVLLYNVPMVTGVTIPPALVGTLAKHPNVLGLKDSSGDLTWLVDVFGRVPESFSVLCGHALAFQSGLAAGACGGILAVADVVPEPFVRLHALHRSGDTSGALLLQRRLVATVRAFVDAYGVAGVKAAMDLRGLHGGDPRPPLLPASGPETEILRRRLEECVAAGLIDGVGL
ncbi:MAG: dihydrodipicolinate synthase family protein [Acidobacteriota bacterium]